MTAKLFVFSGTVLAFLSVALGAFGAHALKDRLDAYALGVFRTGVEYQFYHALALILVGLLVVRDPSGNALSWAGKLFLVGVAVFSGSLYALALSGVKMWGAVTPLGGVCFLAGWIFAAVGVWRQNWH